MKEDIIIFDHEQEKMGENLKKIYEKREKSAEKGKKNSILEEENKGLFIKIQRDERKYWKILEIKTKQKLCFIQLHIAELEEKIRNLGGENY